MTNIWKRGRGWVAAGAAVALLAGSAVYAQPHGGRGRGGFDGPRGAMRGMPVPMLRALDLTDAQKEQVQAIMERERPQFAELRARHREAARAVHQAVTADTFDEGTIRERAAALASVEADLAVLRARVHADVVQLLTPDQRQSLEQRRAEREQRMQPRRGNRAR